MTIVRVLFDMRLVRSIRHFRRTTGFFDEATFSDDTQYQGPETAARFLCRERVGTASRTIRLAASLLGLLRTSRVISFSPIETLQSQLENVSWMISPAAKESLRL